MNDQEKSLDAFEQPKHPIVSVIMRYQFVFMVVAALFTALALVAISLSLYVSSGAIQLDLSRPGYDVARKEAYEKGSKVFRGFPSNGSVDEKMLSEFDALYKDKTKDIYIKAFSGDALSDKALKLEVIE